MDHFIIDYEDGTTAHLLPTQWQDQVNNVDKARRHHVGADPSKEHTRRKRTDLRLPEPKKVLAGSSGSITHYGTKDQNGVPVKEVEEVQMGAQFPSKHAYEME